MKPPLGARLRTGHPDAQGLTAAYLIASPTKTLYDDVGGKTLTEVGTVSLTYPATQYGLSLDYPGGAKKNGLGTAAGDGLELQQHGWAALVRVDARDINDIVWAESSSISADGLEWAIGDNGTLNLAYNDGGIRGWYASDNNLYAFGELALIGGYWDQAAGTVHYFADGGEFGSSDSTTTGTITYASGNDAFGIFLQGDNRGFDGAILCLYLYDGTQVSLGDFTQKFARLTVDPFSMYRRRSPIELWSAATLGGGAPPATIAVLRRRIEGY